MSLLSTGEPSIDHDTHSNYSSYREVEALRELDEYIQAESPEDAFALIKDILFHPSKTEVLRQYLLRWDTISEGDTFLSRLFGERGALAKCEKQAFETILSHDSSAILEGEEPPLKKAIKDSKLHGKAKLIIEFMELHEMKLDDEYDMVRQTEGRGLQCLAAAFEKSTRNQPPLDTGYIIRLVKLGSADMLNRSDEAGMIPLHRLLDFERCHTDPSGQLELVNFLLDRCEKSIFTEVPQNTKYKSYVGGSLQIKKTTEPLSVYRWHRHTKTEYGAGDITKGSKKQSLRNFPHMGSSKQKISSSSVTGSPEVKRSFTSEANPANAGRQRNAKVESSKPGLSLPMKLQIGPHDTILSSGAVNTTKAHPGSAEINMLTPMIGKDAEDDMKSKAEERHQDALQASEKISKELGLRFLRQTVGTDIDEYKARKFFGVIGTEKCTYHFPFDMSPGPGSRKRVYGHEAIAKLIDQYTFYPILRHITLPPLTIKPPPRPNKSDDKYSYTDQLLIFEWLQKKKGVKKIFKVIVDDMERPHRDEDIVNVLAGKGMRGPAKLQSFDVEILDWRKIDICPVVVQSAAPGLRELHLRWGGSNSVLRGWSEPEGLPKLKQLRKIYLHYDERVESSEQIGKYLKQFEERLRVSREAFRLPAIKVENRGTMANSEMMADGTTSSIGQDSSGRMLAKKTEDPWLKYVKDFNALVPDLPPGAQLSAEARKMGGRAFGNVTIALIDDGVEVLSPEMEGFQEQFLQGRSFDTSSDGPAPPYQSLIDHGTFMAQLILQVCPYANIIPYRLMMTADANGNGPHPEAGSAVKAIKEAINEGVDIISMSWTIRRGLTEGTSGQKQTEKTFRDLRDVLKSNLDPNRPPPLMFCAASDDGMRNSSPNTEEFPSAIEGKVFRIGAAVQETGQTWPNVTKSDTVHFVFPGVDFALGEQSRLHNLRSSGETDPNQLGEKDLRRTGSSVATALAAGLAALLIHCTKLGAYHTVEGRGVDPGNSISPRSIESIKTFNTMKSVLEKLSATNLTGAHYADPKSQFEAATRALQRSTDIEGPINLPEDVSRLGPIANLTRNLIPS